MAQMRCDCLRAAVFDGTQFCFSAYSGKGWHILYIQGGEDSLLFRVCNIGINN